MTANPYRDFTVNQTQIVPSAPVSAQQPNPQPTSVTAECGSGWYHDVAIQESKQAPARKH